MIKKSVWQLVTPSTNSSIKPLKTGGIDRFSTSPIASTPSFQSWHNKSFLAKTQQQQKPKSAGEGKKRKRAGESSATKPVKESRCLSTNIAVHPSKRLRVSSVKPITLARYMQAVELLERWANQNRRSLAPRVVDRTITDYLHVLCESGSSIVDARSVVYGFIMLRMSSDGPERFLLSQAKAALRGWSARFPTHSKAGIDLVVWDVIAWDCIKHNDPMVGAAILLQGDLYLRPSELLQLRKHSVLRPSKARSRYWGVVVGMQEDNQPTKTGAFDDCILLDSIDRQDLSLVLKFLYNKCKRQTDKLFGELSLNAYNSAIKSASTRLGLQQLRLTPHVLRHSGPSSDCYHKTRTLVEIQQRGRWLAASSVARYKKPGRMLLLHQKIPDLIWKQTATARKKALTFFS